MQLTHIDIENYVCFKHFRADFVPGVNVIIGRNGAGKTSLIHALVYAMNFMFTNDNSMGGNYLSSGNPDLKMNSVRTHEFYRNRAAGEAATDCSIKGRMLFEQMELNWDMYKKSTPGAALYPEEFRLLSMG